MYEVPKDLHKSGANAHKLGFLELKGAKIVESANIFLEN